MKYYYENKFMIFKLEGRLHKRIVLYNCNYKNHIKTKHPEISIKKIETILKDPDYVYKPSKKSDIYYYEKQIKGETYRVVIKKYKKHVKEVVTGYTVFDEDRFTIKHVHCIYDKDEFVDYEDIEKEQENDLDYFYEMFSIAK